MHDRLFNRGYYSNKHGTYTFIPVTRHDWNEPDFLLLFVSSVSSYSSSWQMARTADWSVCRVGWLVGVRVGLCQDHLRPLIVCLPTHKWNRWWDKYLLSTSTWRWWWNKSGKCTKHVCLSQSGSITLSESSFCTAPSLFILTTVFPWILPAGTINFTGCGY